MVVCEGEWRWSGLGILWRLWRIWFWTSEIKRSQGLYVYWWLKMHRWSSGKKVLVWKKNIKRISFFSLVCQKFKDCTELWFLSLIILIKLKVLLISPTPREEEGTHVLQLYKPLNELPCKEEFLVFFKVQYGLFGDHFQWALLDLIRILHWYFSDFTHPCALLFFRWIYDFTEVYLSSFQAVIVVVIGLVCWV